MSELPLHYLVAIIQAGRIALELHGRARNDEFGVGPPDDSSDDVQDTDQMNAPVEFSINDSEIEVMVDGEHVLVVDIPEEEDVQFQVSPK